MRKSEKILIVITLAVMVVLLLSGYTYAYFEYKDEQDKANVFNSACFKIDYVDGPSINIPNFYPITTSEAKNLEDVYTLKMTNNCDEDVYYNGYINILKDSTTPDDLIKIDVDDGDEYELASLPKGKLKDTDTDFVTKYKFKVGTVPKKVSVTIKLKAWLSSELVSGNEGQGTTFKNKVSIEFTDELGEAIPRSLRNAILADNKDKMKTTVPDFATTGCPTSKDDSCSGLYTMTDYDNMDNLNSQNGTSYYFRGKVENNYVKLSADDNYTWRIVRINGDGSIRLILNGDTGTNSAFNSTCNAKKYVGYTYDNKSNCTRGDPCISDYNNGFTNDSKIGDSSTIKTELEKWYSNISNYDSKIALATFCNDTSRGSGDTDPNSTSQTNFGAYQRLRETTPPEPILTCPDPMGNYGGVYELKIGLLTADEVVMAGFKPTTSSQYPTIENYLYYSGHSESWFWTSSPSYGNTFAYGFYGTLTNRYLNIFNVPGPLAVRPVINLKAGTLITSGDGTIDKPYTVQ